MPDLKSGVIKLYEKWLKTATPEQVAHVDAIYHECERHYNDGGHWVVETYTPEEILADFSSMDDAIEYCGLKVNQALDARWGEDSDEELACSKRYELWKRSRS